MQILQSLVLPVCFSIFSTVASAQAPAGVREGDAALDCAAIAKAAASLAPAGSDRVSSSSRGDTNSGGLLGAIGKAAFGATNASSGTKPAPEAAADAPARLAFLKRLGAAKECKADDASYAGKALSPEEFQQVAQAATAEPASAAGPAGPFTADAIRSALDEAPAVVPAPLEGDLNLKGARFYVAEYRLLFEIAGEAAASTRAGYMPGRDYGASSSKVQYTVKQADIAAFQAITDRAWADFKARLAAAGVTLPEPEAFTQENGAVYAATETGSRPGAPVYMDKNGRKYVVMAPTGMKNHSRGLAGWGAGDISKRIDWAHKSLDGLSVSMAVNIAAHESSGNRSAILQRTAEAGVATAMRITGAPDGFFVNGHVKGGALRIGNGLPVEGQFASMREVGGYDSSKDGVAIAMGVLSNMAGLANVRNTKRVEAEVDLDGPATARLALRGLASVNQALTEKIKAGM